MIGIGLDNYDAKEITLQWGPKGHSRGDDSKDPDTGLRVDICQQ